MNKDTIKYTYSIDSIIDNIMNDADIPNTSDNIILANTQINTEIDNIVRLIKNKTRNLRTQGHKVNVQDFVRNIFLRFQ